MNMQQAKIKLKGISNGKYHSLNYGITEHVDGDMVQECKLYIDGLDFFKGKTWEEAFANLINSINPLPVKIDPVRDDLIKNN